MRFPPPSCIARLPDARERASTGPPTHSLWNAPAAARPPTRLSRNRAKIVGDVMGSFHPHGDQAIYDALVASRPGFCLALPRWSTARAISAISMAINAAASRYTPEARMTEVARLLLEGIDEDAIDFPADL